MDEERAVVQREFGRVAAHFDARAAHRYDDLGVVEFSRVSPGGTVLEVGAGTGGFLSLFEAIAGLLVAVDVTEAMLAQARRAHPGMGLVIGDGYHLPVASRSVDLVACAQTIHHVRRPVEMLKHMRRATKDDGAVLIVDQVATESYEEAAVMTQLDALRDPSHAGSRPPSAYRTMVQAVGLEVIDERIVEQRESLLHWTPVGEFDPETVQRVFDFVERYGDRTGMGFERSGEDWSFVRRRIMLLAARS